MSVAGFYNPRNNMHVFHLPQQLIASLEMGRLKLMSQGDAHVEIGAHEFRSRYLRGSAVQLIRGLDGDPIRKLFYEIPHIAMLEHWSGRSLHWHLADNYFSGPNRDPTTAQRFIDFRVEPIPEV